MDEVQNTPPTTTEVQVVKPSPGEAPCPNPVSTCEAYYKDLHKNCGDVLGISFKDLGALQCASHNYVSDLNKWLSIIESRPEVPMLHMAIREYQFGLLAIVLGQYRTAFFSLRVFLELCLSSVQFSAHEFKLREWLRGARDVNWKSIVDSEEGIFSVNFTRAFFENLVDDCRVYGSIAEKIYRECSEYVHSNPQVVLPKQIVFDKELFEDWHKKAKNAFLAVNFAFCVRYFCVLSDENKSLIEPLAMGELGHIGAIRAYFGAAK
jgi:hypothetical protein